MTRARFIALGGFLGAGKTTTMIRAAQELQSAGDDLDVAPLVVIADPGRYRLLRNSFGAGGDDETDLAHLYHHQLAEADVIALNKIDTLAAADRRAVLDDLARRFPGTPVIAYSAATGEGVPELLDVWNSRSASPREDRLTPFAVDYNRYGAAEAALAWTNQVFELSGSFVADDWLDTFLDDIARRIADRDAFVGHIKVRLATARGCRQHTAVAGRDDRRGGGHRRRALRQHQCPAAR